MIRSILLSIILLACAVQAQVDSLMGVLDRLPQEDTARFSVMDRIARKLLINQPDDARQWATEMLVLATAQGRKDRMATTENLLGTCHELAGRRPEALRHFQNGLRLSMELGRMDWVALINGNIGHLQSVIGDLDASIQAYQRSIDAYESLGNETWAAGMMDGLAGVYAKKGVLDTAARLYDRAAEVLIGLGSKKHAAISRHAQAHLELRIGRPEVARRLEHEALELIGDWNNDHIRCKIIGGLAEALAVLDSLPAAVRYGNEALAIAQRAGYQAVAMDNQWLLADVFERSGQADSALHHLRAYLALKAAIDSEEQQRVIAELRTAYDSERKDAELALRNAQLEMRSSGLRWAVVISLVLLGLLLALAWAYRSRRRMADDLAGTNERIRAALAEKELLLQEVHHRVKNNLQMVGSLLRMQGRSITDPLARQAVRDSQDRVRSMALIHQDLYGEGHTQGIDMGGYVEKLAGGLLRSHGLDDGRIALHVDVPSLRLDVDTAVPIGLILNELIVNALKHAFPDGRRGTLRVSLHRRVDGLHLEVSDDGVGLTVQAINEEGGGGFGLGMLRTFAEKLQAEHETIGQGGTTVRMRIKAYRMAG